MKNALLVIISIILSLLSFTVNAQPDAEDKTLSPYFFVKGDNPGYDQLPLHGTTADVNIAGTIADVTVSQIYVNEGDTPLEAVYTFPASTRAAVYALEMTIGNRTITAQIKEKGEARRDYEAAKSEGKRTSLLEQNRPNVFTMNVANIAPGDRIEVTLRYTELLIPTDGTYQFVYPTVVGPRYSETSTMTASADDKFIASPYTQEGEMAFHHFDINVHLSAGMPIQDINCSTHKVNISYPDLYDAEVILDPTESIGGNRDFIFEYQLQGGNIQSGLMLYEGEDENFFTLMVQPPKRIKVEQIPPREYIFIVDVSGSMHGFPLETSKKLLKNLILNLRSTDRFNVMLFSGDSYVWSDVSKPATLANAKDAISIISKQHGGGGTRLLPALGRALDLPRPYDNLSRSVVVVTDGYISVEKACFDEIRNNLDKTNVFAFGIGSGVNRHLIEGMAHVGMGEAFVIPNQNDAAATAERFREYIQTPVLTQVKAEFDGFEAYDIEPTTFPDVLAERPILIQGKWRGTPTGKITIKGYTDKPYKAIFDVADVMPDGRNVALKYLWARKRIELLDDYGSVGEETKDEVTALGIRYNLLTQYTSFVAIDHEEIVTKNGEVAQLVHQPSPMPQGIANSAIGCEAAIEGVVRKSIAHPDPKGHTAHPTLQLGEIILEKNADELPLGKEGERGQILVLKKLLQKELNAAISCHKEGVELPYHIDVQVTIDECGTITEVKLLNKNLDETVWLCIKNNIENHRLKNLTLGATSTFSVPIKFVL